jgi:hypothetical protein
MNDDAKEPIIPYAGPTTPRRSKPLVKAALVVTGSLAASAGAALFLVSSTTTRCSGSTRSARLMFEARQRQIEREIADDLPVKSDRVPDNAAGDNGNG